MVYINKIDSSEELIHRIQKAEEQIRNEKGHAEESDDFSDAMN